MSELAVPSTQLLNLIQHHLIESGLTETSKALLSETNVGSRGLLSHAHANLIKCAKSGDWGSVLDTLSGITLDKTHTHNSNVEDGKIDGRQKELNNVLGHVHEMAILELGDAGEMDLAFATLKICREALDGADVEDDHGGGDTKPLVRDRSLSQSVERKLHSISALRSVRATAAAHNDMASNGISMGGTTTMETMTTEMLLPPDYYGNGIKKEKRRHDLARRLGEVIPIIPSSRLTALCQQAIKWQIHTGEMPMVKELWQNDDEDDNDGEGESTETNKKKRKKKQEHRKKMKRFDLVLGEVDVETATRDILMRGSSSNSKKRNTFYESIPLDPWSTIKFGKKTTVTSCIFFVDTASTNIDNTDRKKNQSSLITGSSDGFIEIWDAESKYAKLRMDLEYQKKDEIMCHYGDDEKGGEEAPAPSILAMTVNSDGTMLASGDSKGSISVWSIRTGQCVCEIKAHTGSAITCLDFSRDGHESSRILSCSQDTTCREFGLRTKRMLKEFRGHTSFLNSCAYVITKSKSAALELLVVTASADGTVRVWCGRSAEVKYVLNPLMVTTTHPSAIVSLSPIGGQSEGGNGSGDGATTGGDLGININTVIPLHTPSNAMVVVPRGQKIYLMTYNGLILRTFENDGIVKKNNSNESSNDNEGYEREDFVTATVSPSNKWLYAVTNSGVCLCFDMATGKVEQSIRDFCSETVGGKSKIELSGIAHHPFKGIIAAFSSSPAQKRGLLTLWK